MKTPTRPDLDRPLPPSLTVREARDAYLDENGFTMEAYDEPWTKAKVLGITYAIPNTAHHAWAIQLHDLHHAITGFGTNLVGEGEISGWELAGGLRGQGLYISVLILLGFVTGMLLAPRRTLRAYRAGGQHLLNDGLSAEDLLDLNLGDLRERLGVPREGLGGPRKLHEGAPRRDASPVTSGCC